MSKLAFATIFVAALGAAAHVAGAGAGTGQCYTADGRPTGPAYELAQPDRDWIEYVTARGGRCSARGDETARSRFTEHETPNHRHLLRNPGMREGAR